MATRWHTTCTLKQRYILRPITINLRLNNNVQRNGIQTSYINTPDKYFAKYLVKPATKISTKADKWNTKRNLVLTIYTHRSGVRNSR